MGSGAAGPSHKVHWILLRNEELCWSLKDGAGCSLLHHTSPPALPSWQAGTAALALGISFFHQAPAGSKGQNHTPAGSPAPHAGPASVLVLGLRMFEIIREKYHIY